MAPKRSKVRTCHFKSSELGLFRPYLLRNLFLENDEDHYQSELRRNQVHNIGEYINQVDVRHYSEIGKIVDFATTEGVFIKDLIMDDNLEVNNELIQYLLDNRGLRDSLEVFSISNCINLDRNCIQTITGFSQLKSINLSKLHIVDNIILSFILPRISLLESLNISECPNINDEGLTNIADILHHKLLSLNCSRNKSLTEIGINKVILKCESLEELDISYCININFIGVIVRTFGFLQNASRKIKNLNINGCVNLSIKSLNWICVALPDLEYINFQNCKYVDDTMVYLSN